ncbi:MAG TPA: hypothetical protein VG297_07550 [Bryobacteraceae bacterium]|jgi:hypothetical protein|nr:hypothetical protein [Bryobacteraceae bacterium]
MIKKLFLFSAMTTLCSPVFGAQQTWTGKISDGMCGADHSMMQHGTTRMTDKQCTEACVKAGQKHVLASNRKIYQIANQSFPGVAANAGNAVRVTGETTGDGSSIKIARIERTGATQGNCGSRTTRPDAHAEAFDPFHG